MMTVMTMQGSAEMLNSLGFTSPPKNMAKKEGSEDAIGCYIIIIAIRNVIVIITIVIIII